jgi:hypothetical protein
MKFCAQQFHNSWCYTADQYEALHMGLQQQGFDRAIIALIERHRKTIMSLIVLPMGGGAGTLFLAVDREYQPLERIIL